MSETIEQSSDEELDTQQGELPEVEETQAIETENETTDSEQEEDFVEVEREGKKYAIPKALQADLLRQEDYTRKTQEVAELRRQAEQQQQHVQQTLVSQRENLAAYAKLQTIDAQIEQFRGVDWNALSNDDPVKAQQAFFRYTQLRDERGAVASEISQREQQQQQQRAYALHEQIAKGREVLAKEIPGFGAETVNSLVDYGVKFGYSEAEVRGVTDPKAVKLLWKAMQYDKLTSSKPQSKQEPAPVAKVVRAKAAERPESKMSTDEWMAKRNREITQRFKR